MRRSVVVLAVAVVVLGVAVLASAANIQRSTTVTKPVQMADRQVVLYSQLGTNVGGAAAQDFEAAYDVYDCAAGDDFQVTWADGWRIQQLHTPGTYSTTGPAAGIQFELLADGGGFPGAVVCSGLATVLTDVAGDITSDLPVDCDLTPAVVPTTYWLSVAARLDYAAGGQWYAAAQDTTVGNIAKFYNPGDGFALGCTTWAACDLTVINAAYLDLMFEVLGETIPVELQSFQAE